MSQREQHLSNVRLRNNRIHVGERFSVSFQRTLRIPDDGGTYPLPPGLGLLPVHRVADYRKRAPGAWQDGDFFIPMYQREALWLGFDAQYWKPNAVKVAIGGIDAISGKAWERGLQREPQNYIVCPDQPWLDGINIGSGVIRQFVAMPLGAGYTVEGQMTGEERVGGIQLVVFEPRPGRFPDVPPADEDAMETHGPTVMAVQETMGLAAGGQMEQAIYRDQYGVSTWDPANPTEVLVHIVNSADYAAITGRSAPPTPIDARSYTAHGFPWFTLYDETRQDIPGSTELGSLKSIGEIDHAHGGGRADEDRRLEVPDDQILGLKGKPRFKQ